jgi:transposase-like protein
MTKAEQVRLVRWRMKVLQHARDTTQNVSQTCRYFGISRKTFYKWKARYEEHGEIGLCDRSRAPHRSANATPANVMRLRSDIASSCARFSAASACALVRKPDLR